MKNGLFPSSLALQRQMGWANTTSGKKLMSGPTDHVKIWECIFGLLIFPFHTPIHHQTSSSGCDGFFWTDTIQSQSYACDCHSPPGVPDGPSTFRGGKRPQCQTYPQCLQMHMDEDYAAHHRNTVWFTALRKGRIKNFSSQNNATGRATSKPARFYPEQRSRSIERLWLPRS